MKRRTFLKKTGAAGLIYFLAPPELVQNRNDTTQPDLEKGFLVPPTSAHPQTLWFWMNGNVTKEGISMDLEAMKAVGVGGVLNFDAGTGIPKGPVEYLSEEWLALKKHAMKEADRLGLEFAMHNCPGWSSSGGPWITPEIAMQQLTWSETYIAGGKPVSIALAKPANRLNHYRDIAVVAFPSLGGEELLQSVRLSSSNEQKIDKNFLTGNSPEGIVVQPSGGHAWLQFRFEQPYEARLLTFFIAAIATNNTQAVPMEFGQRTSIMVQASDDGVSFRDVVRISTGLDTELLHGDKYIVFDIPVTTATYFRLTSTAARRYKQVQFSGITRLKNWMEKTNQRPRSFLIVDEPSTIQTTNNQPVPKGSVISLHTVVDLTANTSNDGVLNWQAPPGNWTIIRMGFTPTGSLNKAAPQTGVGLECDKYNAAAITFHFNKMTERLLPVMKQLAASKQMGLEIDSYEAGSQNWTPGFEKLFRRKWNYSITPYLPVLAGGRIINDVDFTERFLWDFRRLQADLMAENYYGQFSTLCRQHGITAYFEPYESGPFEEMQIGSKADVNLSEFWGGISTTTPAKTPVIRTPKLVSSIAHTNGQKLAGAEAFTSEPDASRWQEYPFAMKALGDKIFTKGINRLSIHRYAHQPHTTALPGMTMGPWGIHFDRTNTWWKQGRVWLQYLSRCQYLLQQGRFVADLAYFTGEDANMYTKAHWEELHPTPPPGYDYDVISAESLLQATIVNKRLLLKNGMSYRVFVFQKYRALTLTLLLKLRELVQQGMVMVGQKPERSLGLADYGEDDTTFNRLVNEVWGNGPENRLGSGIVYSLSDLAIVMQKQTIQPDFSYSSRSGDAPLLYLHREIDAGDIYFISNQRRTYEEATISFRVKNKQPELWDPVTGNITALAVYELTGDRVQVPVQLNPYGSQFIVFRKPATGSRLHSIEKEKKPVLQTKDFPPVNHQLYKEVVNDFTVSFWAKPEINILLQPDFSMGTIVQPWTEYYAVHPSAGDQFYGKGHATCGLAVGRNGIAVWENATGTPVLVLAVPISISGWGHIAVRYKEGVPTVYLNGKKVKKGERSNYLVHPAVLNGPSLRETSWYNGDMSKPVIYAYAMEDDEIKNAAAGNPSPETYPFVAQVANTPRPSLLINENGNYTLRNQKGLTTDFTISGISQPVEITGPWQVEFSAGSGAPSSITLPQLMSLHQHNNEGVRYFSGTALYTNKFNFTKNSAGNIRWFLDLGMVEVIAEVTLNGKDLGVFWTRPYRMDITEALKQGTNHLRISVTNLWPNRLIGDEQSPSPYSFAPGGGSHGREGLIGGYIKKLPDWYIKNQPKPADGRVSFTTWQHYHKDSPLLASGLIGPVILLQAMLKEL